MAHEPSELRVLVVDDDWAMRAVVSSRLADEGYEVHETASGSALLRVVETLAMGGNQRRAVDLIVLDLRMPGMNGLETIRRLREAGRDTPVILISAFADESVRATAQSYGVPVLSKPFAMDVLANMAVTVLVARGHELRKSSALPSSDDCR